MTSARTDNPRSAREMVQPQKIHCPGCGRFQGFQAIAWGYIKLKCSNCKEWIVLDIGREPK